MSVKITSVATQLPPYSRSTQEILPYLKVWMAGQEDRFQRKVLKLFENAGVDRRYSIMDADQVFQKTSFEEKNEIYKTETINLAESALTKALDQAKLSATDIDFIITVSCTGIMIPSVDAFLINRLKMRQDVVRLPVTEMGCAAGVSALIYANNFLRANPGKKAAIVAVESPMSTFQWNDFSMANMVSAAIFGDGAAAVILGTDDTVVGPTIEDTSMFHFYDETDMMGFELKNSGFKMVLDVSVPDKIEANFENILFPFLEKNNLTIQEIQHLIFHPGGKKIVKITEELFGKLGKDLSETKGVLRDFGNMSSATVLYVLKRFLEKDIPAGERGLMLSFGPGFRRRVFC